MTKLSFPCLLFILIIIASCRQTGKQATPHLKDSVISSTLGLKLVDYKSETYKIKLGDSYKLSNRTIDWKWSVLDDADGIIDSTGKDAFLDLGEPLVNYNNDKWLPSLYITTDKNIITSFTCNIVFDLENSPLAVENFLMVLSKQIEKLKNKDVIKSIKTNGHFQIINADCIETYKLTKGKNTKTTTLNIQSKQDRNGR